MKKTIAVGILLLSIGVSVFSQDIFTQLSQKTVIDLQSGTGSDTGVLLDAYAKVYPALKGKEAVAQKVVNLASLKKNASPRDVMAEISSICEVMNKGKFNNSIDGLLSTTLAYTWELMALKIREEEFAKASSYIEKVKSIQSLMKEAKTTDQIKAALSQYAELGQQAKKEGYVSTSADIFNGLVQIKEQLKTVSGSDYIAAAQALLDEGFFYDHAFSFIYKAKKYAETEDEAKLMISSFDPKKRSLASRIIYGKSYYYWLWANTVTSASIEDRSSALIYYSNGSDRALSLEYQAAYEASYARGLYEWIMLKYTSDDDEYFSYLNASAFAIQGAIATDPQNIDILMDCCIICFKIGFHKIVADAADTLIAAGADNAGIRYYRGISFYMYSLKNSIFYRKEDALTDLNMVLSASPEIGNREIIEEAIKYYKEN